MPPILFPEWDNEQENSPYPFADNTTRTNGTDEIPNSIFTDARLYVIGGGVHQFLSSVDIGVESAEFTISDDNGVLAQGVYVFDEGGETIGLVDDLGRPAGVLVGVISRAGEAHIPSGSSQIQKDDIVTLLGRSESIDVDPSLLRSGVNVLAVQGHNSARGDGDFELIVSLAKKGLTVMLVEQNAARALEISDRGYVLELGRNRFEGTGKELLDNQDVRKMYLGG